MTSYQSPARLAHRPCAGCGAPLLAASHPPSHRLCRRCFGYAALGRLLDRALGDVQAARP